MGIAFGASLLGTSPVSRFEVSRAVPSPQEEVATGEVPPLFLVRGTSPPPLRTLQALLRAAEA